MVRNHREGKTKELLYKAAITKDSVIIVNTRARVIDIVEYARKLDLQIDLDQVITFQQFLEGIILSGRRVTLFIDDVDALLHRLAGPLEIDTITITGEGV